MCDAWYENMDNGELNGVVFIDIRKAFDSINHNILLRKMKEQFWISNELKLFESYLSDREQVSFVNLAQCQHQNGLFVGSLKDLYWPTPYCSYSILMIYLIVLRSQPHAYVMTIHRYFHLRKTV
jgi:hypothetical protein